MKKFLCLLLAFAMVFSVATGISVTAEEETATISTSAEPIYDATGTKLTVAKISPVGAYYCGTSYGKDANGNYLGLFSGLTFNEEETYKTIVFIVFNNTKDNIEINVGAKWAAYLFERTGSGSDTDPYKYTRVDKVLGTSVKIVASGATTTFVMSVPKEGIAVNSTTYSVEQANNGSGTEPVQYGYFGLRINKPAKDAAGNAIKYTAGESIYIMTPNADCVAQQLIAHGKGNGIGASASFENATEIPDSMRTAYDSYKRGVTIGTDKACTWLTTNYSGSDYSNYTTDISTYGAFRFANFASSEKSKELTFYVKNNTEYVLHDFSISYYCGMTLYAADTQYAQEFDSSGNAMTDSSGNTVFGKATTTATEETEGQYIFSKKTDNPTTYKSSTNGLWLRPGESATVTVELPRMCDALNGSNIYNTSSRNDASYKVLGLRLDFTSFNKYYTSENPGSVDIQCLNDDSINFGLQKTTSTGTAAGVKSATPYTYTEPTGDTTTYHITSQKSNIATGIFKGLECDTDSDSDSDSIKVSLAAYKKSDDSNTEAITKVCLNIPNASNAESLSLLYKYNGKKTDETDLCDARNKNELAKAKNSYIEKNSPEGVTKETVSTDVPETIQGINAINNGKQESNAGTKILSSTLSTLTFELPKNCYTGVCGDLHYVYYDTEGGWVDTADKPADGIKYTTYYPLTSIRKIDYSELGLYVEFGGSPGYYTFLTLSCIECQGTADDDAAANTVNKNLHSTETTLQVSKKTYCDEVKIEGLTSEHFYNYLKSSVFYEDFENTSEDNTFINYFHVLGGGTMDSAYSATTATDVQPYSGNKCLKFTAGAQHYCQVGLYISPLVLRTPGKYTLSYKIYIETLPNGNCTSTGCSKYVQDGNGDYVQYKIGDTIKYIQWAGKLYTTEDNTTYTKVEGDNYVDNAYVEYETGQYARCIDRYIYNAKDASKESTLTVQARWVSPKSTTNAETTAALTCNGTNVGLYKKDYNELEAFAGSWQTVSITFDVGSDYFASSDYGTRFRLGLADYMGTNSVYYIDDLTIARTSDLAEASAEVSAVAGAGIDVTADLSLPCYALVPVWAKLDELSAVVTRNGKTTTITSDNGDFAFITDADELESLAAQSITVGDNKKLCKFTYGGIGSQCMGDDVNIVIKYNGSEIASKNYSVKQYCQNMFADYDKLSTKTDKDEKFVKLLADMLEFGSMAQKVVQYKSGANLPNELSWVSGKITTFTAPTDYVSTIITTGTNTDSKNMFTSAGIDIHSTIKIRVNTTLTNSNYKIRYKKGEEGWQEATVADDGYIRTGAIAATEFGTEFVFQIYSGNPDDETFNKVSELTYSVNTYIYRMNSKNAFENATDKLNLIKAMYNFGQSAKAYNDAVQAAAKAADNNEAT